MTDDEWKLRGKLIAAYHGMMILREAVHFSVSAMTDPEVDYSSVRRHLELSLELSDASVNHV